MHVGNLYVLTQQISNAGSHCVKPEDLALQNANHCNTVDGPTITVSPMRATLVDSRPSCRDAILDAIARLHADTGATAFARTAIVAEVRRSTGAGFERQTIYRCLRRMAGLEPGSAHVCLEDLDDNRLRLRA
jgi:hypothetical protein